MWLLIEVQDPQASKNEISRLLIHDKIQQMDIPEHERFSGEECWKIRENKDLNLNTPAVKRLIEMMNRYSIIGVSRIFRN